MESETIEVMDGLFQGNLTISEASEKLSVSENDIHHMIDNYEYVPSVEQIYEIGYIIKENLNFIENDIIAPHKIIGVPIDKPITTDGLSSFQIGAKYLPVPTDANGNGILAPYPEKHPYHG